MNIRNVLPKDVIPSIDTPAFDETYFGSPDDEVLVIKDEPSRAYPLRILSYDWSQRPEMSRECED